MDEVVKPEKKKRRKKRIAEGSDRVLPATPVLIAVIVITWAFLFATRQIAPSDLLDNDQERPAAYVLDILVNGNWIVQFDDSGEITSKPPLYTWLVTITAKILGRFNEFTLYLPGALCLLASVLLIFYLTQSYVNRSAAFLASIAFLLSFASIKQMNLARTDPLFALLVFGSAIVAFESFFHRKGWLYYWILCALATLTKGPIGIILSALGLIGLIGSKRKRPSDELNEESSKPLYLNEHVIGVAILVVLCGGWFLLAWIDAGKALTDKMIGKELVGHAVDSGEEHSLIKQLYTPALYFLGRNLPWSLFSIVAIFRVFLKPSESPRQRSFERFMAAYVGLGIVFFSMFPHQRYDHQFPLLPAAAILAGIELARLLSPQFLNKSFKFYPAVLLAVCIGFYCFFKFFPNWEMRRTQAVHEAADYIRESAGAEFPVMHLDTPMGLQFYLGTKRLRTHHYWIKQSLLSDRAAFAIVRAKESYEIMDPYRHLDRMIDLKTWEQPSADPPYLRIIGNRPKLQYYPRMVFHNNEFQVDIDSLTVNRLEDNRFELEATDKNYVVAVTNHAKKKRKVTVIVTMGDLRDEKVLELEPEQKETIGNFGSR